MKKNFKRGDLVSAVVYGERNEYKVSWDQETGIVFVNRNGMDRWFFEESLTLVQTTDISQQKQ